MFLSLISFVSSLNFNHTCKSNLKVPDPVPNATLEQVILLTRHGFRAPFDGYGNYTPDGWICDSDAAPSPRMSTTLTKENRRYHTTYEQKTLPYPPSCRKADLTVEGQELHVQLGAFYRKYLIEQLHFLPESMDPEFMYLRSSEPERCIRSLESFMHGLYPPEYPDEFLKIVTGTDPLELLHPRPDHCADLTKSYNDWINSSKYLEKKENAARVLKDLVNQSGLPWDEWQWLWVGDWLYTIACVGKPLPDFITQEMLDVAMDAVEFYTLDLYQHQTGVAGASIIREVLQHISERQAGEKNHKFVLLSAHDISIVAACDILGIKLDKIPPFASHMMFEVYRSNGRFLVRVSLNGEVILKEMTLQKFKGLVLPYINYCKEVAGTDATVL
ncbi:Histidine acid phosphatase family protein [Trichomonas vaginalis G3]|uniref:Histidine acid phosphatase family protein n=1 Tax=Trichomonas vaginalis (strain ATCC PRA-98 / G3) TaxID=412133 RepID=A2DBN7_TRIV3|nr:histidine acid phosphatase [Trichomonas vaginalis G3]EAY22240.1 Histidine acid phosphatase family protein [Trichomonas vaginalis G3]KAI5533288.1 acid phosphatase protein [Trichomonas vaginalis G3]|eukprot:XP_001583226.1 histidine acid phosphatase [Trichomonas vaginalis G3]